MTLAEQINEDRKKKIWKEPSKELKTIKIQEPEQKNLKKEVKILKTQQDYMKDCICIVCGRPCKSNSDRPCCSRSCSAKSRWSRHILDQTTNSTSGGG